jgi:acetyl esterase/lipase
MSSAFELEMRTALGRSRPRAWRIVLAAIAVIPAFLVVLGALVPAIPIVGTLGTVVESFVTLHLVVLACVGTALAYYAVKRGAGRFARLITMLGVAAALGSLVPLVTLVRYAHQSGTPLSWSEHLRVAAAEPALAPDSTQRYASPGGKSLYADIYLPAQADRNARSTPVVMMHGGGFAFGTRSQGTTNWNRWLTARGYTVFDVDYRLSPPVTWNQAAPDIACALTWLAAHADQYHVAPERVVLAGQSAGGGLAMQVAYGIADGTVASSCGGTPMQPRAVLALYPPDDLALPWKMDSGMGPISGRKFNIGYIGGSPAQFPERYRTVSPVFHIRAGSAPTFIGAGAHDHLVPLAGHIEATEAMKQAGVPYVLMAIPYADHGYDAAWGSLGSQITRHAASTFMEKFAPATAQ